MNCQKCNGDTCVLDSRPVDGASRRRRVCLECNNRFSTVEIMAEEKKKHDRLQRMLLRVLEELNSMTD